MSLIKCPKCGKEISDLGLECIYCGNVLLRIETIDESISFPIKCPECGDLSRHSNCDSCGCSIGECYYSEGCNEDELSDESSNTFEATEHQKKALWYFRKAANIGYPDAINEIGALYYNGSYGIQKNAREAIGLYYIAAKKGNSFAQYNLACCYDDGVGTKQCFEQAIYWYTKAAEQDNLEAIYNLGLIYLFGRESEAEKIDINYEKALKYITKAVEMGNSDSKAFLGIMHLLGLGILVSTNKAIKLISEADSEGSMWGKYYLGLCYYDGKGVDINKKKAKELISIAAENGIQPAKEFLSSK